MFINWPGTHSRCKAPTWVIWLTCYLYLKWIPPRELIRKVILIRNKRSAEVTIRVASSILPLHLLRCRSAPSSWALPRFRPPVFSPSRSTSTWSLWPCTTQLNRCDWWSRWPLTNQRKRIQLVIFVDQIFVTGWLTEWPYLDSRWTLYTLFSLQYISGEIRRYHSIIWGQPRLRYLRMFIQTVDSVSDYIAPS